MRRCGPRITTKGPRLSDELCRGPSYASKAHISVSARLGRREEARADRQARAAFAVVAPRYLAGQATDEELRTAATASASQEGRDLMLTLSLAREYLDFLVEKHPGDPQREVESFSAIVKAWVHYPKARRDLEGMIDRRRRWVTFDPTLRMTVFEHTGKPPGPVRLTGSTPETTRTRTQNGPQPFRARAPHLGGSTDRTPEGAT